jgi:hypothetical protein
LEELSEVPLRIMRAWGGLRVVLDGENGVFPMAHPFDGTVIEVKVRDLKRLRTRHASRISLHREAMVL